MTDAEPGDRPQEPKLPLRNVWGVIREMQEYAERCRKQGEDVVGATVLEDWADRLAQDQADLLRERRPELERELEALERAKKISPETLRKMIDI